MQLNGNAPEDWQVQQAGEAVKLFRFHSKGKQRASNHNRMDTGGQWKAVVEEMTQVLRLKHLSVRTEKTYIGWLRSFYRFLDGASPFSLDSSHVKDFLTYLAVERKIAASTQNQAFSAILFLYRHVLYKEIEDLDGVLRARRKRRLPVVLTKGEVLRLFDHLTGVHLLVAQLIYGCGLRLQECLRLRIKGYRSIPM